MGISGLLCLSELVVLFLAGLAGAGLAILQKRQKPGESSSPLAKWLKNGLVAVAVFCILTFAVFTFFAVRGSLQARAPMGGSGHTDETGLPASTPPVSLTTAQDYLAQGDYDFEQGGCEQAIADYTTAIELNPDFAEAYYNRAYTYMTIHNYAAALPDLDRAIQIRPDYVNALMNRGDIYNYYYQIDRKRAIADYDRVEQIGSQYTSATGHRAMAELYSGNLPGFLAGLFQGR